MKSIDKYCKNSEYFYSPDYSEIIESFEYEILIEQHVGSYQGDSLYLFKNSNCYGYLCFGWGSCSGCDALQACNNLKEVEELQKSLYDSIIWFDDKSLSLKWFLEHDWNGDYIWWETDSQEFVKLSLIELGANEQEISHVIQRNKR